jgi:hypothetical protein
MKKTAKFSLSKSSYGRPTPELYRKLGDALLSISTFITGFAIYEEMKWLAFTALIIGSAGKFLTNFYSVTDTAE